MEGEEVVLHPSGDEGGWVIDGAIELDDGGGTELTQDGHEKGWGEMSHALDIFILRAAEFAGATKGDQLARNHLV